MVGPIVVSNDTKLSRYMLDGGVALVDAAVECMRRSDAEDPYFLGKAEGLCMAIAHASGADLDWVRDYISDEAF